MQPQQQRFTLAAGTAELERPSRFLNDRTDRGGDQGLVAGPGRRAASDRDGAARRCIDMGRVAEWLQAAGIRHNAPCA
jgi:hypothetical protein